MTTRMKVPVGRYLIFENIAALLPIWSNETSYLNVDKSSAKLCTKNTENILKFFQKLAYLEERLPLAGVGVVDVLLPLEEGPLLEDVELVEVDEGAQEESLGEPLLVAEHLQRVHGRQLQRRAVAHVRLQHRLVPLQRRLLRLGRGLVAAVGAGGGARLGDVAHDHLENGFKIIEHLEYIFMAKQPRTCNCRKCLKAVSYLEQSEDEPGLGEQVPPDVALDPGGELFGPAVLLGHDARHLLPDGEQRHEEGEAGGVEQRHERLVRLGVLGDVVGDLEAVDGVEGRLEGVAGAAARHGEHVLQRLDQHRVAADGLRRQRDKRLEWSSTRIMDYIGQAVRENIIILEHLVFLQGSVYVYVAVCGGGYQTF